MLFCYILFCAMLSPVVLSCAMLVFVVPCYDMLCYAQSHVEPWYSISHVKPYCAVLPCCAMLCDAVPCYAMSCHVVLCRAILCYSIGCAVLCHTLSLYPQYINVCCSADRRAWQKEVERWVTRRIFHSCVWSHPEKKNLKLSFSPGFSTDVFLRKIATCFAVAKCKRN